MSYEKVSTAKEIVVGTKQTVKAIQKGRVQAVILAADADPRVINPVLTAAEEHGVQIHQVDSMQKLGKACGIDVKASAVGIIKEK
ncbi:MAG TPA: 50S ribosomal protein L7ae-like protein [Bacillus sp. (in: firmicutes)]|uniref:50S ribosomal protein L7ae-like protein n=1 Tax=Bacillus litorisediminis TaxID=2922713 RepID=UPI001FAF559D|nr:50S ribosomal protein L7ae-like protein [Bacillus litorisediminis]HWO78586.1 50S ribosomal protein L7ae-like protein [Bacillus sp. (in: firmicutes)]